MVRSFAVPNKASTGGEETLFLCLEFRILAHSHVFLLWASRLVFASCYLLILSVLKLKTLSL